MEITAAQNPLVAAVLAFGVNWPVVGAAIGILVAYTLFVLGVAQVLKRSGRTQQEIAEGRNAFFVPEMRPVDVPGRQALISLRSRILGAMNPPDVAQLIDEEHARILYSIELIRSTDGAPAPMRNALEWVLSNCLPQDEGSVLIDWYLRRLQIGDDEPSPQDIGVLIASIDRLIESASQE